MGQSHRLKEGNDAMTSRERARFGTTDGTAVLKYLQSLLTSPCLFELSRLVSLFVSLCLQRGTCATQNGCHDPGGQDENGQGRQER